MDPVDPTSTADFIKAVIAGQARHMLTGVGGILVAHGALASDQQDAFVQIGIGLIFYVIGAAWSWWQKDGQAFVKAQYARLRRNVEAIPPVPAGAAPSAPQVAKVNAAIDAAKAAAIATT